MSLGAAMPHLESDPPHNRRVREVLMIAFLGGLVTFSAFGAAILAFLTGGNVLDNVAQFWVEHATSGIFRRKRPVAPTEEEEKAAEEQRKGFVSGVLSGSVAVIQVVSGAGMIGCGLWLLCVAEDWKHPVLTEICYWTGVSSFLADAVLITLLTGTAVLLAGILPLFSKPSPGNKEAAKPAA
jgi:hypothetical protein